MSNATNSANVTLEALSEEELAQVEGGITATQFWCGILGISAGMFTAAALGATGVGSVVAGPAAGMVGATVAGVCMEVVP